MIVSKDRKLNNFCNKCSNNNSGFTLVELVVVLALMAILFGTVIAGGLGWQDWARFNHEETVAEDIFFVAQNQLTELDSSGALTNKVVRPLMSGNNYNPDYVLATAKNNTSLTKIAYSSESGGSKKYYVWNEIWDTYLTNNNVNSQRATIIRLMANSGDYDLYMKKRSNPSSGSEPVGKGAELLFDLIAPYVTDTSVLNGSIVLEFSPEAGQVFSVCYSDRADSFIYANSNSGNNIQINDRRIQIRRDNMVGYYSSDKLYEKLKGIIENETDLRLEIKNDMLLEMIVSLRNPSSNSLKNGDTLEFEIFDGTNSVDTSVMSFSLEYDSTAFPTDLSAASKNPTTVSISFADTAGAYAGQEDVEFRLPVYLSSDRKLHIILDAADVQAGTYVYNRALLDSSNTDGKHAYYEDRFKNTYSFYRFGLLTGEASDVHYIYGKLTHKDSSGVADEGTYSERYIGESGENPDGYVEHTDDSCRNDNGFYGECTTFASYTPNGSDSIRTLEIDNPRHFYNIRYESDYKKNTGISNTFKLISNIDWNDMIGKGESDVNYFLNSYDASVSPYKAHSGIDYDGLNPATGDDPTDTSVYPFPGFRCLDAKDTLTQENPNHAVDESVAAGDSFTISNLTISTSANIVYGVYDTVFYDNAPEDKKTEYANVKKACLNDADFTGITGLYDNTAFTLGKDQYYNKMALDSSKSKLARGGQLPLGLFAENLGTIENITLDKHIVRGMEVVGSSKNIIYSCMVGGFAGNNIGTVKSLALLNSAKDETNDSVNNKTHINGRTDVGGIIGRESFTNTKGTNVTLENLYNEGNVTGYENIGGIVGRAYVHYVNDNDNDDLYSFYDADAHLDAGYNIPADETSIPRYKYYHDGYTITDTGISMSGVAIFRARTVSIEDCHNKGLVGGDSLLYSNNNYIFDGINTNSNDYSLHGSFIGGIAGITIDGYMMDINRSSKINIGTNMYVLQYYINKGFHTGAFSYMKIKDCSSTSLYDKTYIYGLDFTSKSAVNRDCYVGGLIGYTRFSSISNCITGDEALLDVSKDKVSAVLGRRYVGGVVGCSDQTYFSKDGSETYTAENYNLVIGERYVGGVAGGVGIGDVDTGTLDFRNPSKNEASSPSNTQPPDNSNDIAQLMVNHGIALAWRDSKVFNDEKDMTGITSSMGSGCVGGIVGASRSGIRGCDNIQSEKTKKYNLRLIGFTDTQISNWNNLSTEDILSVADNSKFGGNCSGGILGAQDASGFINRKKGSKYRSQIDAIVFGQDYVGGGLGVQYDTGYAYNFYPLKKSGSTGCIIIGRDSVGGLIGKYKGGNINYPDANTNNNNCLDDKITASFSVYGRIAVGGVVGIIQTNNNSGCYANIDSTDGVSINGIAFVGGFAGYNCVTNPRMSGHLSGIEVNAKYFAGGYIGLLKGNEVNFIVNRPDNNSHLDSTVNIKLGDIKVNSDIFAGGVAGICIIPSSSYKDLNATNGYITNVGTLHSLILDNLYQDNSYINAAAAYSKIVKGDISGNIVFNNDKDNEKTLNMSMPRVKVNGVNQNFENTVTVESKIFAGGLFGYIPEGTNLKITNFTNNGNIKVTDYVGAGSGTSVSEAPSASDKYAYMGGIVGRVPKGTILDNCMNLSTGAYSEGTDYSKDDSSYYSADNATYLGGLTEVNAGTIQNCMNKTDFKYDDINVGALAGINAGEAEISDCVNLGSIKGEKAAGIVAGSSGSDVVILCRNYGKIEGASGSYGIAAGAVGTITKNLEAGGLGLSVNDDDPVAPQKSKEPLDFTNRERNFYIYGNVKQSDLDNGSGNQSTGDIYFSSNDNNLVPALSIPEVTHDEEAGTYTLNVDETRFKKISLTNDSDETRKYVNNIQIASPSGGLDMDFFRIYWLRLYSQYGFKYTVSFTYLDDNNEEQRVYYDRAINKMANFDDTAEPDTDIGYHNQDVLCYDEISIRDNNGNRIKPVKIQIYADYQESVGNEEFWYSAFTWGKYTDTGRNEYMIVDEANKVSTSDMTSAALNTALIDTAYISCNHDTANEKVRYSTIDRWSKQLVILEGTDGKYNLVYKRYGMYKRDNEGNLVKLMPNGFFNPAFEDKTPQQKYDTFDKWFVESFAEDTENYPDSDFVN